MKKLTIILLAALPLLAIAQGKMNVNRPYHQRYPQW